jgi:molecular chaperone GrpE
MSEHDDDAGPEKPRDLEDELQKAMSEAEAAVDAVRDGEDEDEDVLDINPTDEPEQSPPSASDEVDRLSTANAELRDKWLRSVADLENFRKRVKRDIDDQLQQAAGKLLESFLPTVDNLERAMGAATDADTQLLEGIRMVTREFMAALGKHGISPIESVGKPFDPNLHDALQQIDSPDHPPGVIVQEFEKGYIRGERLLRPARVVVAGPGSTGTAPESGAEESDADAEA